MSELPFEAFSIFWSAFSLEELARGQKPLRFLRQTLGIRGKQARHIVEQAFLTRLGLELGEAKESAEERIH